MTRDKRILQWKNTHFTITLKDDWCELVKTATWNYSHLKTLSKVHIFIYKMSFSARNVSWCLSVWGESWGRWQVFEQQIWTCPLDVLQACQTLTESLEMECSRSLLKHLLKLLKTAAYKPTNQRSLNECNVSSVIHQAKVTDRQTFVTI